MAKFYSLDLRRRVLKYVEATADKAKASQLFKVGTATIYRWIARKKQNGNLEPSPKKAYKKKIDDHKLIAYVEKNPDHFLLEIATHFNTTLQAIFYALRRLKFTRKKKTMLYKERNEEARAEFIQKIELIPHFLFLHCPL